MATNKLEKLTQIKWLPDLAIVLLILFALWFKTENGKWKNKVIDGDALEYYSYLPAVFIDHDITLGFLKDYSIGHVGEYWPKTAENGNFVFKMTMGTSLLYAPFFGAAHLYVKATGGEATGFSQPYHIAIAIGALVYLFLGLIATKKILKKYFNPLTTSVTLILTVLATNLLYYATCEPGMNHVFNFCLMATALLLIDKWLRKPSIKNSVFTGLLIGLISLIRPSNTLIVLFFLLWNCRTWPEIRKRLLFFRSNYRVVLIMSLAAILVWVPQMIYWKMQTGHIIYNSYVGEQFYFGNFNTYKALLGYRKGWLVYTPVMFFAIAGFFFMNKELKKIRTSVIVFLILFVYVVFSWWCWWYGGSYGSRPMIDIYAILAIPLAAIVEKGVNGRILLKIFTAGVVFIFVYHGIFQTRQYIHGAIHYDSMTKKAYWISFGKQHPRDAFFTLLQSPDYKSAMEGKKEIQN